MRSEIGSIATQVARLEGKFDSTPASQHPSQPNTQSSGSQFAVTRNGETVAIPLPSVDELKLKEFSASRALQYLSDGEYAWRINRKCISCHTTGAYAEIRPMLSHWLGKPPAENRQFLIDRLNYLKDLVDLGERRPVTPASVILVAMGLASWDRYVLRASKSSHETMRAFDLMFRLQEERGDWKSVTNFPPFASSNYLLTCHAALAISIAPGFIEDARPSESKQIESLISYIRSQRPPHNFARVRLLQASNHWDGLIDKSRREDIIRMVLQHQLSDGGWSIRSFAKEDEWGGGILKDKLLRESTPKYHEYTSDGFMTGLAIFVLIDAGIEPSQSSIKAGTNWILQNQRVSGRWWCRSLTGSSQGYSTYSSTIYCMLALAKAGVSIQPNANAEAVPSMD